MPGAPRRVGEQPQVPGRDHAVLDQHPDGDLVREPDVWSGQAALCYLPPEHLDVLGDPRREPVAELRAGVEPFELVVRAGRLEGGPGDFRCARQRGGGARVDQPWPAPHQRHQEQLGHRVQVKRKQRPFAIRRRRAVGGPRRSRTPVPSWYRHRELQPVVQHRARADHRRSRVDEPAARRFPLTFHARQPDPVAVAGDVECVRPADVGYPGALGGGGDDPGPPGKPAPGRNSQVDLRSPSEHQLASFGEPDDLARRGADVCGHRLSLGPANPRQAPPDPGMAWPPPGLVSFHMAGRRAPLWGTIQRVEGQYRGGGGPAAALVLG